MNTESNLHDRTGLGYSSKILVICASIILGAYGCNKYLDQTQHSKPKILDTLEFSLEDLEEGKEHMLFGKDNGVILGAGMTGKTIFVNIYTINRPKAMEKETKTAKEPRGKEFINSVISLVIITAISYIAIRITIHWLKR